MCCRQGVLVKHTRKQHTNNKQTHKQDTHKQKTYQQNSTRNTYSTKRALNNRDSRVIQPRVISYFILGVWCHMVTEVLIWSPWVLAEKFEIVRFADGVTLLGLSRGSEGDFAFLSCILHIRGLGRSWLCCHRRFWSCGLCIWGLLSRLGSSYLGLTWVHRQA